MLVQPSLENIYWRSRYHLLTRKFHILTTLNEKKLDLKCMWQCIYFNLYICPLNADESAIGNELWPDL